MTVARGRLRLPKSMNRLEAAYGEHLMACFDVEWHKYEGLTLKLGDDCRYTPDYLVMKKGGQIECHEVKGFWRDDARVKIRVAAAMFPFRFVAVTRSSDGDWLAEEF